MPAGRAWTIERLFRRKIDYSFLFVAAEIEDMNLTVTPNEINTSHFASHNFQEEILKNYSVMT